MPTAVKLKKSIKASFNFTGRKVIRAKECNISIAARSSEGISVRVNFINGVIDRFEGLPIVLVAYYGALYKRCDLDPDRYEQTVFLDDFPEHSRPQFRLKVIASSEPEARIVAASRPIRPVLPDDTAESEDTIFKPIPSPNIGDQLWKIDWLSDDEFQILVNSRLVQKFDINQDSMMRAWLYSSVVREILLGLVVRNSDIEELDRESIGAKWLLFSDQKLGCECPEKFRNDDGQISEEALQWAEDAAAEFCNRKWDGRRTLLASLLHGG